MTLLKSLALMILTIINWQPIHTAKLNYSLHGTVIIKETEKPFPQAYIYTVKGEEETLTDEKGEFKFTSWQKLPVTLHVEYPSGNLQLVVTDPKKRIRIEL